jgi:hypothetical protein
VKAAMLVFEDIGGALLFTVGVALGDGFMAGLMVGASFAPLALLVRERDGWPAWFGNFSLLFWGVSFLIGNCWLVYHGKSSSAPFITFGPGFLLMAAYYFAKQRLAAKAKDRADRSMD